MTEIIDTIKNSKVLVVLLIIYTLIAIGVIVLDRKVSAKNDKDGKKSTVLTQDNMERFSSALSTLYSDIDDYVEENDIKSGECIPLTEIYPEDEDVQGSALVTNSLDSYNVWYTKYGLYLNGTPLTDYSIDTDDFETSFSSAYFNNCGLEE